MRPGVIASRTAWRVGYDRRGGRRYAEEAAIGGHQGAIEVQPFAPMNTAVLLLQAFL